VELSLLVVIIISEVEEERQTDRQGRKERDLLFSSLLRRKKPVRQVSAGHHRNRIVIYQRDRQRQSASSCCNSCHHVYGYERDKRREIFSIWLSLYTHPNSLMTNYYCYIEREIWYNACQLRIPSLFLRSQKGLLLSFFFFFSSVQIWGEVWFIFSFSFLFFQRRTSNSGLFVTICLIIWWCFLF
jgi:hypothetical protein